MPATVKVLIKGFTSDDSEEKNGGNKTQPTITLVKDGRLTMLADPGILEDQQVLIDALKKEDLEVNDVDVVFITHSHLDHYRNVGMFPKAKVLDYFGLWHKNTVEDFKEHFSDNIRILHTPGHDYTGISLLVNTEDGVVAICGDVFWKEDYPQDPRDDIYATDVDKLLESRKTIKEMADWIVPGHADMFKIKKAGAEVPQKEKKTNGKKAFGVCKNCQWVIPTKLLSCRCRPHLCYKCCECGLDCDLCNCAHRKR